MLLHIEFDTIRVLVLIAMFKKCHFFLFLQAESFVKAQQEMGEIMGELGLAFIKLTKFESEQATSNAQRVRAADMKNVATAAVKASRLYRELNAHTVKHLVSIDKLAVSFWYMLELAVASFIQELILFSQYTS